MDTRQAPSDAATLTTPPVGMELFCHLIKTTKYFERQVRLELIAAYSSHFGIIIDSFSLHVASVGSSSGTDCTALSLLEFTSTEHSKY
jgi:hypothetical protein